MIVMNRPYVIINCAASTDGKIALPSRKQLKISCDKDIERVQMLRRRCDAILVGVETVIADDPKLTVKKELKQPIRVILDSKGRVSERFKVLDEKAKTIIFVRKDLNKVIDRKNVEVIPCKSSNDLINLDDVLEILYEKKINCLLVEGGGTVIWNFLKRNLFDEFYVYISPIVIGGKHTPTIADGEGVKDENEIIKLRLDEIKRLDEGILLKYLPEL